jgi:predicted transglutaminase-like cysteine proteinase
MFFVAPEPCEAVVDRRTADATFAQENFANTVVADPSSMRHAAPMTWDSKAVQLIESVNRFVNQVILPATDEEVYGVADFWTEPITESQLAGEHPRHVYGDCEDYVLEKRHRLIAAGVAQQNLSIAIVQTNRGVLHAVLLVRTDAGEMVLDNLSYWILPWDQAPYRWIARQILGRADDWRNIRSTGEDNTVAMTRVAALHN